MKYSFNVEAVLLQNRINILTKRGGNNKIVAKLKRRLRACLNNNNIQPLIRAMGARQELSVELPAAAQLGRLTSFTKTEQLRPLQPSEWVEAKQWVGHWLSYGGKPA